MLRSIIPVPSLLLPGLMAAAPIPARPEVALNVSWGDHIMVGRGLAKLDTPARIRDAMKHWKRCAGVRRIFWRVSAVMLERDFLFNPAWHGRYRRTTAQIFARFDPLAAAVAAAHEQGLKIYAYHTIFDEGCPPAVLYGDQVPFPWQSRFTRDHPEYLVIDRTGSKRQWGVMEYAYPEVRKYKIGQFRWLLDHYDFDGLYVCTRSHSPPADSADEFGFNLPVVRAFRRRYGRDIRREPFDREAWRRLRGEYLTRFFCELRSALPGKTIFAAIPRGHYIGPPYGNLYLDWETWLRRGFVDGLVIGVISGKWLYPKRTMSDRAKGYLCSQEEGLGMQPVRRDVEQVYGPARARYGRMLFLATGAVMDPDAYRWNHLTGIMASSMSPALYTTQAYVPDAPPLDLTDARFTIAFLLYLRSYRSWPRLLSKYNHRLPEDRGRGWEIMLDPQGRVKLRLNDGRRDRTLLSRNRVPLRRWTYVACISEGAGGRLRIAIDGKFDPNTAPAPRRLRDTPCRLYFGRYGDGSGTRGLDGLLDEVLIAHRAVPIARRPRPWNPPGPAGAAALWNFDSGSATGFPSIGSIPGLEGRIIPGGSAPIYGKSAPGFGRALDLHPPAAAPK